MARAVVAVGHRRSSDAAAAADGANARLNWCRGGRPSGEVVVFGLRKSVVVACFDVW